MKKIIICLLFICLFCIQAEASSYYWNFDAVNGSFSYEIPQGSNDVIVAVIDSGINYDHEDIDASRIVFPHSFVGSDENDCFDERAHGTYVSSVITSVYGNGKGADGLACGVYIMPLKIYSKDQNPTVNLLVKAVDYAVEKGADIINISMGLSKDVDALRESLKKAYDAGVIIVAAVGNDGTEEYKYPAAYDFVIGVGGVNEELEHDPKSQHNDSVFVCAPSDNILVASVPDKDSYAVSIGTSIAAPHVSALAALARTYKKNFSAEEFKNLLAITSKDLGEEGYDTYFGYGFIDFKAFLTEMLRFDLNFDGVYDVTDIVVLKMILLDIYSGDAENLTFAADIDNDGSITVTDYVFFKKKLLGLL